MQVEVKIKIKAPREAIWDVITDIEHATENISGIEKIEILEPAAQHLVGLKWRETRTLFGKTATEVMWVTQSVENSYYTTRAESHGCVYTTTLRIDEQGGGNVLSMKLDSNARSIMAKVLSVPMGLAFRGATMKALQQDLEDIKKAVEQQGS